MKRAERIVLVSLLIVTAIMFGVQAEKYYGSHDVYNRGYDEGFSAGLEVGNGK